MKILFSWESIMVSLGERIKSIRINNKLTQSEFGDLLGVGQSHIANIEKDQKTPSDIFIKVLSLQFGIREEWLCSGEEPMYRPVEEVVEETLGRYGSPFVDAVFKTAKDKELLHKSLEDSFRQDKDIQDVIELAQKLTPRQRRILVDILGEWTDRCN